MAPPEFFELRVVTAASGKEVCQFQVSGSWTVQDVLSFAAPKLQGHVRPRLLHLLLGSQLLEPSQRLEHVFVGLPAGGEPRVAQLVVHSPDVLVEVASTGEELVVAVDLDRTVEHLGVAVARAMALPPGRRPVLELEGATLHSQDSLGRLGIGAGSRVRVAAVRQAQLRALRRRAPPSRRSEFLESSASLSLVDEGQEEPLQGADASAAASGECAACYSILRRGDRVATGFLAALRPVLSVGECEELLRCADELALAPKDLDCYEGSRRYSRLVVRDEQLASRLHERLRSEIASALEGRELRPLGFGCASGEWELAGLNPCFRLNRYGPGGFLGPHRDAPFSPSVDERSLCTILIPLLSQGATRFYHPKHAFDSRGLTTEEEVARRGGLAAGFEAHDVPLREGAPLIFGQGVLHEGLPLGAGEHAKAVLRTDVMVRRRERPPGLLLSADERQDHMAALRLFREAQQAELAGLPCHSLYERALSYRYAHPRPNKSCCARDESPGAPQLKARGAAVVTPPPLRHAGLASLRRFVMPKLLESRSSGPVCCFEFPRADAAAECEGEALPEECATAAHLRVAAMYALHLVGHHAYDERQRDALYTVSFDPATHTVAALPLGRLLEDAFYERPCLGAVYNVLGRGSPDPAEDLARAVDRTHMSLLHGCPLVGTDLLTAVGADAWVKGAGGGHYGEEDSEEEGGLLFAFDADRHYSLPDCNRSARGLFCQGFETERARDAARLRARAHEGGDDAGRYLSGLLDPARAGAAGLDVVACARDDGVFHNGPDHFRCNCGDCERPPEEDVSAEKSMETRVMNHLVFDFGSRRLEARAWEEGAAAAAPVGEGLHDPAALWSELEARDPSATHRFAVSLRALQGAGACFHHAGEICGVTSFTRVRLEHVGFAAEEHTTEVLVAMSDDGMPDSIRVWTIYHALSAL